MPAIIKLAFESSIEYEIIGEGSQISTNQKRESTVSWLLIGRNLRPFPDNFVLYYIVFFKIKNSDVISTVLHRINKFLSTIKFCNDN